MRAASYAAFGGPITVGDVPEPTPGPEDAVIEVRATGICRSDWHGWQGHDPDIGALPHVPGHELSGVVAAVGGDVTRWTPGEPVAVPFISGCGRCRWCAAGQPQVCPDQTQPGFTHHGSFAERVLIRAADVNLVALPEAVGFDAAAAIGCRVSTAHRAVVDQGRAGPGDVVAVWGCGGVGVAAVAVAAAVGARAVGIDPRPAARQLARDLGAEAALDPAEAVEGLRALDEEGPAVTIDAVGSPAVVAVAVAALRRGGRHVQVGLLPGAGALGEVAAGALIARELSIVGSHGATPAGFAAALELTASGALDVERMIRRRVDLEEGARVLERLDDDPSIGITMITRLG